MKKVCKKLLVLIITVLNLSGIFFGFRGIITNAEISSNINRKDRLEEIKEKGILTVASSNDIPFAFIDSKTGKFTGVDAEIIIEVARRLGIDKVQMKKVPFENLLGELNNNKDIDIVTSGMYVTEERKKEALFTNIWYREPEAIIIPKVSKISNKEDLKNSVVGAQMGTVFTELAQNWKNNGQVKEVIIFGSKHELISAVKTGTIDAAITDSLLPVEDIIYLKTLIPYKPEIPGAGVAAAVKKSDTTLANAVSEKIDEMKEDMTLFSILKKYGMNENNFVSVKDSHILVQ